jgi:integrase
MIRAGVHPKVLQELMGHETFQVTMNLYGHLYEGQTTAAAKQLDALLEGEQLE